MRFPTALPSVLLLSLTVALASCAEGTLKFGGIVADDVDSVSVTGDVDDVTPPNAVRDMIVFVFTNLVIAGTAEEFDENFADATFDDAESVVVAAGSSVFAVSDVASGRLTVVFLRDDPEPDGQIDSGDPVAVLDDADDELDNIRGGRNVTLDRVDIDFDTSTAVADNIVVGSASGN